MSVNYPLVETAPAAPLTPRRTFGDEVGKFIRTKPLGVGGALIILAMIFVAIFAAALAPYDPYVGDYAAQFARPSRTWWWPSPSPSSRARRGWCGPPRSR